MKRALTNQSNPVVLLSAVGVSKKIGQDFMLRELSFEQAPFQKLVLAGETGCGKSTLLKMMAGLVQPDGGALFFQGNRIEGPADRLVPGHPHIAYLSQQFELPKFLRVDQALAYNNLLTDSVAQELYEICRIEQLLSRKTDELSGGERQRVALARLLGGSPQLLLLDEPFAHLDQVHKNILKSVIRDIGNELSITCTLVSHDPTDTLPWADEIMVLKAGVLIQKGSPGQIYGSPVNEYVAGLFGKFNHLSSTLQKFLFQHRGWKSAMIRPEKLVPRHDGLLEGIITEIAYFGSFQEATILVQGESLIVRVPSAALEVGATVRLDIA